MTTDNFCFCVQNRLIQTKQEVNGTVMIPLVFPGCDYQTTILPCFAIHIFVLVILAKWRRHIHPHDTPPKDTRRTGKINILLNDTIQPVRWVSLC
jgi:hypothetical protein